MSLSSAQPHGVIAVVKLIEGKGQGVADQREAHLLAQRLHRNGAGHLIPVMDIIDLDDALAVVMFSTEWCLDLSAFCDLCWDAKKPRFVWTKI